MKNILNFITILLGFSSTALAETCLFDAAKPGFYQAQDVQVVSENQCLHLTNKEGASWPGMTVNGPWSIPRDERVVADLVNFSETPVQIVLRFNSPGADPNKNIRTFTDRFTLAPQEARSCKITLPGNVPVQLQEKLFGMRGYPGGIVVGDGLPGKTQMQLDRNRIDSIIVYLPKPADKHHFGIRRIYLEKSSDSKNTASDNEALTWNAEKFFPMIDRFGQYKHADWPGKIHSEEQLRTNIKIEDEELKKHPGPTEWNRYGGWTQGPKLNATGHFRAEKIDGKWWIVDPDGCLFWSHGCAGVRTALAITGIQDREHLFEEFPTDSHGRAAGAVHNYYVGKGNIKTYNFTTSNLKLKYGNDWQRIFFERTHQRLKSWGMNTIANWSEPGIFELRKTPYTATANPVGVPVIGGSRGHWGKFRDPFSPLFRMGYAQAAATLKKYADDPWCLGFYIDNELGWGNDTSLALAVLQSPPDQPAKIAMIAFLKNKYDHIESLNRQWNSDYKDWQAILENEDEPNRNKAGNDLKEFYAILAEEYFKIVSEELKKVAPNKMYLGCRFSNWNETVVRLSARYCDLVSFNLYRYSLDDFSLPSEIDKGVIVGEFHFGALDRGLFHAGLRPTANQRERAQAYETYVVSALRHPNMVGVHWFLFGDQATTGRPLDGENYQIGLLDVCDTPYRETIEVSRKMGEQLYQIRWKSAAP